jgi:hypothetical protein
MHGPFAKGHFNSVIAAPSHTRLTPGTRYRVAKSFTDYDGHVHEDGETWTFLGDNFVPYHDGMSLFVSLDGEREWQIRLEWTDEGQGEILDSVDSYIQPL